MIFQLILNFSISDIPTIHKFTLNQMPKQLIIVINNESAKNEFKKYFNDVFSISELVPTDSIQEIRSFEQTHEISNFYDSLFSNIKFKTIPISAIFKNKIKSELLFLEKVNYILTTYKNSNILLCLSDYNYYSLASFDLANFLDFTTSPTLIVKNHSLVILNPNNDIVSCEQTNELMNSIPNQNLTPKTDTIFSTINFLSYKNLDYVNKAPVMFFLQTNSVDLYLKPVYPIMEEFKKNKFPFYVVSGPPFADEKLNEKKIKYINFKQIIQQQSFNDYNTLKIFLEKIKTLISNNNFPLLGFLCRYFLNDAFYFEIIDSLKMINFFLELIIRLKPISIFIMPDTTLEAELLCEVAKLNNIPTVTTIASSITPNRRGIDTRFSNIITCYGGECYENLKKLNVSNNLILTGNPTFDIIKDINLDMCKKRFLDLLQLDFNKKIVTIATSGIDPNEKEWMYELINYSNKKNYQVIIQLHPAADIEKYEELKTCKNSLEFHLIQVDNIVELFTISDVVITDYSSVGLIAVLAEKPLIVVNLMKKPFIYNRYVELGVALFATNLDEIKSNIENLLTQTNTISQLKESRTYAQNYFNFKNDGLAANRIFNILTENTI